MSAEHALAISLTKRHPQDTTSMRDSPRSTTATASASNDYSPRGVRRARARLLVRVHSVQLTTHQGWLSHGVYCKLYLGDSEMVHGSQKGLFAKRSSSNDKEDDTAWEEEGAHRVFHTEAVMPRQTIDPVVWDENFDVAVLNPSTEILSVRVKSKHRLFPSVLGVCCMRLNRMKMGKAVDQWFPVMKGEREVARLRLQLVLSPMPFDAQGERKRGVLHADIKTALAANHAADDAIERLLASAAWSSEH